MWTILGQAGPLDQILAEPIYLDVTVPRASVKSSRLRPGGMHFAYVFAGAGKFCNASAPLDVPTEPVG